jgi:hypothetical protein
LLSISKLAPAYCTPFRPLLSSLHPLRQQWSCSSPLLNPDRQVSCSPVRWLSEISQSLTPRENSYTTESSKAYSQCFFFDESVGEGCPTAPRRQTHRCPTPKQQISAAVSSCRKYTNLQILYTFPWRRFALTNYFVHATAWKNVQASTKLERK